MSDLNNLSCNHEMHAFLIAKELILMLQIRVQV